MREIKFRGKRKDNGEWVYGYYTKNIDIKNNKTVPIIACNFKPKEHTYNGYEIIPETVGQFTGLYDKNGKEVYEGDVVRLDLNNEGFVEAVVTFRYGCFVFDTPKEVFTVWESDVLEKHIEVIGNIHDKE